jgi:4-aminobutyrate aminotransferase
MPIGAIVAKEKVMSWPRGSHGSTYGGNPVCCAAAVATLEIIEELLPQIRKVGQEMMEGLRVLQKKHPVLADVRGHGLMIGSEFLDPATRKPATALVGELEQMAFREGLLLLSCGQSTIRFAPPLVVTSHEVKIGLEILDRCLTKLAHLN